MRLAFAIVAALLLAAPAAARGESPVLEGLRWLARHQGADGGWRADLECGCAGGGAADEVELTGLSLLAFLGAGYTHLSREVRLDPHAGREIRFGNVVRRAIEFLESTQDEDGCFGPREGDFLKRHAIATLAMSEAYGLTNAVALKEYAQRGVFFIETMQVADVATNGWCIMALKSADICGLELPPGAYDGPRRALDAAASADGFVDGDRRATAIALVSRIFMDRNRDDALLDRQARIVASELPAWDPAAAPDFPLLYHGTLALFQFDAPCGPIWKDWNKAMQATLVPHQKLARDGCADGSWDPGSQGRVYATALATLTLENYYRYSNVFGPPCGEGAK